jgi:hypothetical protein
VGGVRAGLRSANNDGAQGAAVPCHPLHLSLRGAKKTPSKARVGPLWPKVAPKRCQLAELQACWCSHGKHAGARRPTLGCSSQFAPPTWSLGGELSCASQAFVRKSCAKCGLGLFAGRGNQVCCEDPHN